MHRELRKKGQTMYRTTVKIDGMACSMCEAHVQEAIRKAIPSAKKVSASHVKKEATFVTDDEVSSETVKAAVSGTGYDYVSSQCELLQEQKKKGLFGFLKG